MSRYKDLVEKYGNLLVERDLLTSKFQAAMGRLILAEQELADANRKLEKQRTLLQRAHVAMKELTEERAEAMKVLEGI